MTQDVPQTSVVTAGLKARCPRCGGPLRPRGKKSRTVVTQGGQAVRLAREWAVCPSCGTGLFPPG